MNRVLVAIWTFNEYLMFFTVCTPTALWVENRSIPLFAFRYCVELGEDVSKVLQVVGKFGGTNSGSKDEYAYREMEIIGYASIIIVHLLMKY